jgi:16S rRNA (guanine527-N7)-methyltransferase
MTFFGREDVEAAFDVSRETMQRLDIHAALLKKWNPRINLVSRDSLSQIWHRHIADSAQIWRLRLPGARVWLDLGAGAGFPGLVIAAFAAGTPLTVRLVEADERKSAFLAAVIREANLPAVVLTQRAEALAPQSAEIISARAFSPLATLLELSEKHRVSSGIGLFPKGQSVHKEIEEASRLWRFTPLVHPSLTDPAAGIVEIGALERV